MGRHRVVRPRNFADAFARYAMRNSLLLLVVRDNGAMFQAVDIASISCNIPGCPQTLETAGRGGYRDCRCWRNDLVRFGDASRALPWNHSSMEWRPRQRHRILESIMEVVSWLQCEFDHDKCVGWTE
jgi:hypothetical protein